MWLERKDIEQWTARRSAVWSTQLNDLRLAGSLGGSAERTLLRELKLLALFRRTVYVRDVDLINNLPFLDMFVRNRQHLQHALETGMLVAGLRLESASYADLNSEVAARRARPDAEALVAPLCQQLDAFIASRGLVVVGCDTRAVSGAFEARLEEPLHPIDGLEDEHSRELLGRAIAHARTVDGERLYFGHMYPLLVREGERDDGFLIQLVRAAHVLAVPWRVGVCIVSADDDLRPDIVSRVLRGFAPDCEPLPADHLPRLVPDASFLDRVNFKKIAAIRATPEGRHQFACLDATQDTARREGYGSPKFRRAFIAYLEAIAPYLQRCAEDMKVELVDWQEEIVVDQLANYAWRESLAWKIPVALGLFGTAGVGILTMGIGAVDQLAAAASAIEIGGGVVGGVKIVAAGARSRAESRLAHVVTGTTTHVPPEADAQ